MIVISEGSVGGGGRGRDIQYGIWWGWVGGGGVWSGTVDDEV